MWNKNSYIKIVTETRTPLTYLIFLIFIDRYGSTWADWHGGTGGMGPFYVGLNPSENIVSVTISATVRVNSVQLISNQRTFFIIGNVGGQQWTLTHPNCILAYISGYSFNIVYGLYFHFACIP